MLSCFLPRNQRLFRVFRPQMQHVVECETVFLEILTFLILPVCCTLNKILTRATFET